MTSTVTPDSPNTSILEGVPGPLIPGTRHDALIGDGAQAVITRYWQYGKGMNDGTFPEGSYPVLLVHGFRGDHHGLEIIANYLLKLIPNVSIISPDLPGFGRSADLPENSQGGDNINAYVAWLNDFVEHINPTREDTQPLPLHLVGHSFGSIVTSAFAAAHPNSLALLSLINPISEPALEGSQRVASRLASLYYRAGAALPKNRLPAAALATDYPRLQRSHDAHQRQSNAPLHQRPARRLLRLLRLPPRSAQRLRSVHYAHRRRIRRRHPSTGANARCRRRRPGHPETARAMYATLTSRSLPASSSGARERLDMIPEVGHLIHYETPRRAAELIADFAADHSGNEK